MWQLISEGNGNVIKGEEEVRSMQKDHFNYLLNFVDDRDAGLSC